MEPGISQKQGARPWICWNVEDEIILNLARFQFAFIGVKRCFASKTHQQHWRDCFLLSPVSQQLLAKGKSEVDAGKR